MPVYRLLPVVAVLVSFAASTVDAQFYRGRRGVFVRAPFVGVNVTPGGVSVRAPGVRVNTPRRGVAYGYAPGYVPPVYHRSPVVVASPTPTVVTQQPVVTSTPTTVVPTTVARPIIIRLSEAQLAALSQADLLAELANRSTELNAELGGLSGGEGWQSYLALPESITAGAVDPAMMKQLLARFDSVARDQQYRVIASLGAFEPARIALRVMVDRFESRPPVNPTGPVLPVTPNTSGESLPTPAANATPATNAGVVERSVLGL